MRTFGLCERRGKPRGPSKAKAAKIEKLQAALADLDERHQAVTPFQRMWIRLRVVLLGILITSVLAFCGRLAGVG